MCSGCSLSFCKAGSLQTGVVRLEKQVGTTALPQRSKGFQTGIINHFFLKAEVRKMTQRGIR